MFVIVLFLIFLCVVFIAQFDDDDHAYLKWIYIGILFLLTLMVGFKPIGVDKDSMTYFSHYELVDGGVIDLLEPSFKMINAFAHLLGSPQVIFIIYALLAIPLKGYAITKMSSCWFLSLSVWMYNYFILQECTQIRTAVASSLFLFAIYYLVKKQKREYLLLIFLAVFFHYSALVLLPLVLLRNRPLNFFWKLVLLIAPLICYAINVMGIDPLTMIPIPLFQEKLYIYESYRDMGISENVNIFNLLALFRLGCYYFILWKCDTIAKDFEPVYLLLKITCFSICVFSLFAYIAAVSMRLQELLGVTDILLFPAMIYAVRPEWTVRLVLGVVAFAVFTMNIFMSELLSLG